MITCILALTTPCRLKWCGIAWSYRLCLTTAYAYNDANRLASFTRGGTLRGEYTYNARGQLIVRTVTNSSNNGTTVYFYDLEGHVIAEYDGVTGTVKREYIWLGDRPVAIVDPGSPSDDIYYVHADHLNRPIAMTDAGKNLVAEFTWRAFGELASYTGTVGLDLRFPGQMLQAESGLYYNWFRQYDPTTGRYTQPDPLGLVDGPSRYAYVVNDPLQQIDPRGTFLSQVLAQWWGWRNSQNVPAAGYCSNVDWQDADWQDSIINIEKQPVAPSPEDFADPDNPPAGWEWRGKPPRGGHREGAWHNPTSGESFHDDTTHPAPKPPHHTYTDKDGNRWDSYDGGLTWVPQ